MKASMWSHQLLTALAEHPEFTEEQRAVLYDALDLFTPAFFETTYPNPDWSTGLDQPIRKIEQRARIALGPALAMRLLAQLGPDEPRPATAGVLPLPEPPAALQTPTVFADEAWPAGLSVSEGEAASTYASLLRQNASERRRTYGSMPSATKAALWNHQLRLALRAHSEYTTAQRAVIRKTLSLLTADFFEIDSSSPRWVERVDAPLRTLMAQAQAEFGPKTALELFGELGPRKVGVLPPPLRRSAPMDDPSGTTPYCTCNVWYDFCGSNASCVQGGCYFQSVGCGWFWQYSCTGLCVEHDPPYG